MSEKGAKGIVARVAAIHCAPVSDRGGMLASRTTAACEAGTVKLPIASATARVVWCSASTDFEEGTRFQTRLLHEP